MFRNYKWLLLLLFFSNHSIGQSRKIGIQVSPKVGFSKNQTSWGISGNLEGAMPNIMSELLWSNISGASGLESELHWGNLGLKIDFSKSYAIDGTVKDVDYLYDNRQGIIYNENFSSKNSKSSSFQIASEYGMFRNKLFVNFGYNSTVFENRLLHEYLNYSNYKWNLVGLQFGVKYKFDLSDSWVNYSGVDFLMNKYDAVASWVLREDLQHPKSFSHKLKQGFGVNLSNYMKVILNQRFSLGFRSKFFIYSGKDGVDTAYLKLGTSLNTKLYYVRLTSVDNYISFLFTLQ